MTPVDAVPAVLVAVDGGPHGWHALAWAAAEAAAGEQPLRIVHVVDWSAPSDAFTSIPSDRAAVAAAAGQDLLDEAAQRARDVAPDLQIVTELEAGARPGAAILRAGRNDSLIVLGRRRHRRAISSRFGWSVGPYVARRAPSPVVIVGLSDAAAGQSAGRVAVVVEDDTERSDTLMVAFRAAAQRCIGITVLQAGSRRTAESLHAYRDAFPDIDVHEQTLSASLGPALATASAGAALLVLGARRAGQLHRALLAPAARTLADAARTPILIVQVVSSG